jgi:hypothetical protein
MSMHADDTTRTNVTATKQGRSALPQRARAAKRVRKPQKTGPETPKKPHDEAR